MIFDRIPDGMETDDYEQAIVGVKNAVSEMNGKLDELLTQINIQIKKEFHVEKDTNLKACLIEWYERQSQASKRFPRTWYRVESVPMEKNSRPLTIEKVAVEAIENPAQ